MRLVRDTGHSGTLSPTIAASQEISGFPSHSDHSAPRHDQLQISRYIANTRKHPQHLPACHLFSGRKWKCTSVAASFIQFGQKTFHRSSVPICRNIYYLLILMNETFCWTMFPINILINYGYLKCHVEMSFLFIFSIWSKYLSGSQSLDRQEFTHLKSIIIFCQTEGQRICNI